MTLANWDWLLPSAYSNQNEGELGDVSIDRVAGTQGYSPATWEAVPY